MISADEFLRAKSAKTNEALERCLGRWVDAPPDLIEAIRYSLFAGGKRLRPALVLGAAEIACGNDEAALPAACALEMIHTFSLIHDDLPAMDDDDMRRGKLTLHKVHGEAMAILAGDALLAMAFEVLAETNNARVVGEIARASGPIGMAGGQVLDMAHERQNIGLDALRRTHALKTGALIRASVRAGAMLGGADEPSLQALTRYAEGIGLAFQIADDILDVVGDADAMGKSVGADAQHHKATYPSIVGLDRSRILAQEAVGDAVQCLDRFGAEADAFRALAAFIVDRNT